MARLSREQMRTKLCAMIRKNFTDKKLEDEAQDYVFAIYNAKKERTKKDGTKEEYLPSYAELEKMVKEKYSTVFDAIARAKEKAKSDKKYKKAAEEAQSIPTAE